MVFSKTNIFVLLILMTILASMISFTNTFAARGPNPVLDYKTGARVYKEASEKCKNGTWPKESVRKRCAQIDKYLSVPESNTKCESFMTFNQQAKKIEIDTNAKAQCKDKIDALKKPEDDNGSKNECGEGDKAIKTYFDFGCDGVDPSKGGDDNPIIAIALTIIGWITGLVSVAVVGAIVYGGFLYLSAQDNSSQTQKGIEVIVNAIIGLLLLISFYVIINFVVPGGLFR